jgi:hypothetical protein
VLKGCRPFRALRFLLPAIILRTQLFFHYLVHAASALLAAQLHSHGPYSELEPGGSLAEGVWVGSNDLTQSYLVCRTAVS